MNYTIDASVFVASSRREEINFATSREFVRQIDRQTLAKFCPTLILAECAAAIARASNDPVAARDLVTLLQNLAGMNLVVLDATLAERAAQIAVDQKLRGADAVYVTVAQAFDAILITWDNEMLERGAKVVQTMTPTQWLEQNQPSQDETLQDETPRENE